MRCSLVNGSPCECGWLYLCGRNCIVHVCVCAIIPSLSMFVCASLFYLFCGIARCPHKYVWYLVDSLCALVCCLGGGALCAYIHVILLLPHTCVYLY